MADISKVSLGGVIFNLKDEVARKGGGGGGVSYDKYEALAIAISILQGSAVAGLGDNVIVENFEDSESFFILHGRYDAINHQVFA